MKTPLPVCLAALSSLVLLVGGCTGSDSGSSSSGGSSSGSATVQFTFPSASLDESVALFQIAVELSEAVEEDVEIVFVDQAPPFGAGATEFVDYQVITLSPLMIPAGGSSASILVGIVEDTIGELDEGVQLRLVAASNADVGSPSVFTLTIEDNDATPFAETEPNNDPLTGEWNDVGPMAPGLAYEISGVATPGVGEVDLFHFTATADTDVFLGLDPVSVGGDLTLVVVDTNGMDLVPPVNSGPGLPVSLVYPAVSGEEFLAEVSNTGTGSGYSLLAVGLEPVSPVTGEGEGEGEGEVTWRRVLVVDENSGEMVEGVVGVER